LPFQGNALPAELPRQEPKAYNLIQPKVQFD
jgi:hypothetical protein